MSVSRFDRTRARIFKCEENDIDPKDCPDELKSGSDDSAKFTKSLHIAKGPVEGSVGFDRRQSRRNVLTQSTQLSMSDKPPRANSNLPDSLEMSKPASYPDNGKNHLRPSQVHFRGNQDTRTGAEQGSRWTSCASALANGVTNGSGYSLNGGRRQASHNGQECNQNDRQDPDFDRRYDKWAARIAVPHPQQQHTPLPIFGQLLYPYNVHASPQHLHTSALHVRSIGVPGGQAQQANIGPYHSLQLHHTPSGAMMFQHLGQGNGGLVEYAGRSLSLSEHGPPYNAASSVEQLGHNHSREMSSLQHQAMPPQATRTPSPAYGLDSTVDFPPLP